MNAEDTDPPPQQLREQVTALRARGEISDAQRDRGLRLAERPGFAQVLGPVLKEEGTARAEELERVFGPRGEPAAGGPPASAPAGKSLPERFMDSISHSERWLPFVLVTVWTLAPHLPFPAFQAPAFQDGLTLALGVSIIYLILSSFRQVAGGVATASADVQARLFEIQRHLRDPAPPTETNFNHALPSMKAAVMERINARESVLIRVLGISAQFSWRNLVEDAVDEYLAALTPGKKLEIRVLVTSAGVLEAWGQDRLRISRAMFDEDLARFRRHHVAPLASGRLALSVAEYDNLPHWHGIMVDDDLLFLGRSRWKGREGKRELKVGQNVYRRFAASDRFGGSERIEQFVEWFEAYEEKGRPVGSP